MTNTSASGGYLQPAPLSPLPGNLSFKQFVQSVFVGITGLKGSLVRPSWQKNPPKQPSIDVNWLAIAIARSKADTFAYTGQDSNGNTLTDRNEDFEVQCTFYGPESDSLLEMTRDNFQITQNLEALRSAQMGFVECGEALHVPDLVNARWVNRYEMTVYMPRNILRSYPVLTFSSASGTITADLSGGVKTLPWNSGT